ncbi:hypothetical protein OS965_02085 [Streptomyces sp. H27-G5]|uniref:hypothetical protein n=1 Tax=Streptomyces sp. H27-G5 TaxID=2996698 RepID=UPI00226EDE05|nr:hypothetical protein [Streptomyces sp. H27-G5]MCY0916964.1 hypothetical protein [Streptomyces sp. H27-G5]
MLQFTYATGQDLSREEPIRVIEGRGKIHYELHDGLFLPEAVAALNIVGGAVLAGGQWFQLWRGDVISMYSPEAGGPHGRLHRGPVAHEATGPDH